MAGRSSKKTQADLIESVLSAGWREDAKSRSEWRWWHHRTPGIYYKLRDAADLVRIHQAGMAKQEAQKGAGA